jgi:hypothetical protein
MPSLEGDTTGLPQTTRSGIYYEIETLSYREAWVPGGNRTTVVCRVLWDDSFDWITDMVGRAYTGSVDGVVKLRRDLPEQNPYDAKQWCTRVEQVDQGGVPDGGMADGASGWPVAKWARYRCTFEGMPHAMLSDEEVDTTATTIERELRRYVVRGQRVIAKEQDIPAGGFKTIEAEPLPLFKTGFRTIAMGDVTYTWMRVPVASIPDEAKTLRGTINETEFDASTADGGYDFAAGQLLYVGYDDHNRYFDANEDWVCDLVYSFRFKGGVDADGADGNWNLFLDKTAKWVGVSTDGTEGGTKPYGTSDFDTLFRAKEP